MELKAQVCMGEKQDRSDKQVAGSSRGTLIELDPNRGAPVGMSVDSRKQGSWKG